MMRSFSFMQATEEDFMEGMTAYEHNGVGDGTAHGPVAPEPPALTATSLSFRFQHQMPEVPTETALVSREFTAARQETAVVSRELTAARDDDGRQREEEKEPHFPLEPFAPLQTAADMQEHRHDEAEETEFLAEEPAEERSGEVAQEEAAPPKTVAATHNYQFLTERDFRGFVREPEAVTVRVQESFVPSPPPAHQPEERRVVDVSSRSGRFLTARDFRPANEPDVCESVASSGKWTPPPPRPRPKPKPKPASSPSAASMGGGGGFTSEFSGFGDSDSESSASDGYSVKDLVVDSDSDWFLSEKEFPASALGSGNLKTYKAKVLRAIEAMEAASNLEPSYQEDSATTVSPSSVRQRSPDTVPDGSPKFPEDVWSRSPSPDVEYKEDEEEVTREAEAQYDEDIEQRSTGEEEEGKGIDMSDDEHSSGGKEVESAPIYDLAPVADDCMDHSEKGIITLNDHSGGQAASDAQRSPEAVSARQLAAVPSDQVAGPVKRSPEPPEQEFVGMVDHSLEHSSYDRKQTASESDQSYEIVFDDKRRPQRAETGFLGTSSPSHELVSEVWEEIVTRNDQPPLGPHADEQGLDTAEEEYVGTGDQPHGAVSDEKSGAETPEQEFSLTDHRNVAVPDARNISETREDEEQASADDHSDNAVTGKAKVYDEDGEDREARWKDLTDEEEDELESLWEHQDLVEQLKLELKKVRSSVGLPTILEESDTPKAPVEDLKPWSMDAKFLREDPMDELNKFYKSYRERMRKLDILCYQKMYAIDFLQLRGSQQSNNNNNNSVKSLSPTVASILSHNFRSSRRRSPEDPSERFLRELRYDLETVYVGQMCLSWEFLRWQYEQARDLPESDSYHSHQYNQVAGEFQQFQVVVQRFVEDESFKGPRLSNYINNRCVLRNLLQVPVIKEDSLKDRMEDQRKGNYVITSEELEDVMEEAMHVLWEFIKADRAETTTTAAAASVLKGLSSSNVELQDPLDHGLMAHIHSALQKKEKRLKDLLRTGNCIAKKFKKPKEDRSNQNLFFSQVDMKLVARVLRMPRITSEQLQWCRAKLDKIVLVDRKIHREASFLLFPC
ncbi:hypothetical protein ZEAMMB73_Zm00001d005764 [Zea mays]|nr:hypothetical protein ZEAMMB73_Zm00001d005764 [Zea mays]